MTRAIARILIVRLVLCKNSLLMIGASNVILIIMMRLIPISMGRIDKNKCLLLHVFSEISFDKESGSPN